MIFNNIEDETRYPESGWHLVCEQNKTSNNDYLRVKPGCDLRIRLISNPYCLIKLFTNDRRCINLQSEEIGRRLQQKYGDKLRDISIRYASWCIDRKDNSWKILDMPMSVARAMGNRQSLLGKKIAGIEEGCDWRIITNGKTDLNVRYEAIYLEETPLAAEEKSLLKSRGEESLDLDKVFRPLTFEDAEKRLLELD